MDNQLKSFTYYPNKMGRILLLAMEEVLGREGMATTLYQAELPHRVNNYPPNNLDLQFENSEVGKIQVAIEMLYGQRGGQGLAQRSGRASFKYALHKFGAPSGCTKLSFRLLPLKEKIQAGTDIIARVLNEYIDQTVRVSELPDHYLISIEQCPICRERHSDSAICHLVVGLLEESLYWVSNGKYYNIRETACSAMGDAACVFDIDKHSF